MKKSVELFPFKEGDIIGLKKSGRWYVFQRWEGNRIIAIGDSANERAWDGGWRKVVYSLAFDLLMWEGFTVLAHKTEGERD